MLDYHTIEREIAANPADPRHSLPSASPAHARILDVGCGAGQSLLALCRKGEGVGVGVDVDAAAIDEGRRAVEAAGLGSRISLLVASGSALPFESDSFDLVFSRVAVPYMDIPKALAEMTRVLVPDGQLWLHLHSRRMVVRMLKSAIKRLELGSAIDRLYALINGFCFEWTGRVVSHPIRVDYIESWQSEGSIRKCLERVGIEKCVRVPVAEKLIVAGCKSPGVRKHRPSEVKS